MDVASRVRELIKAQTLRLGLVVRRVPAGRHGDAFADQARLLERVAVRRIFDVGAYHGETALRYRRLFPGAEIHCFEPVPGSFSRLEQVLAGMPLMIANKLAVSDSRQPIELHINRFLATSSRLHPTQGAADIVGTGLLDVVDTHFAESITIDEYCLDRRIGRIDVLKLDVQGGELAALRGAKRMLESGNVSLVYTEVLVNRLYEAQPGVGDLLSVLEGHDYRLYGLYNLVYGTDSALYQMDAIMMNPQLRTTR
jgi:FkbM family methyltransferase